ncbi:MAG: hypothetical protein K0R25_258 [Rickettsiaceae bacterium]|jgi:outer membrane biosynthesis protein TonB|nr:hypothetical protein [Rickettsiaceae bacterium]
MKYPLTSIFISLSIWMILFAAFGWRFSVSNQSREVVNIDANLIREVKSITKDKQEIDKSSVSKTADSEANSASNQNQNAAPISQPLPKIPDELRQEAFQSYAIARFHIAADGSFSVELIKPCNNPRLNFLLLESLKKWKFNPEKRLGIAIASTKDIRVDFKVE